MYCWPSIERDSFVGKIEPVDYLTIYCHTDLIESRLNNHACNFSVVIPSDSTLRMILRWWTDTQSPGCNQQQKTASQHSMHHLTLCCFWRENTNNHSKGKCFYLIWCNLCVTYKNDTPRWNSKYKITPTVLFFIV